MHIGRSDIAWNYAATFLQIGSSILLLPLILRMMPAETVGIWTIFTTVVMLINLFDFGFNPSFTRNVTYVFSGVRELKATGHVTHTEENITVDFGLLKNLISCMRWFYSRMSILLFLVLISLGTYYIHTVLQHYSGNHTEVYIAWCLLCIINIYSLYTKYYDSLMQGKGLIKRSKQIAIAGQMAYLLIATGFLLFGQGLIAIVAAQASSVIIVRVLSYRSFFTKKLKKSLSIVVPDLHNEILNIVYPNAVKVGLTAIGGFAVSRLAIIIGALYLSLEQIASYGITVQVVSIISSLSTTYTLTYLPKIIQFRVQNNTLAIKEIYLRGQIILFCTYAVLGSCLLYLGNVFLLFIGSKTLFMSHFLIITALIINLLENNHSVAGGIILMSKNEVPFFKASLLSGGVTLILLIFFLNFTTIGILGLLLAPGIAQVIYQNWKWPLIVKQELNISLKDYLYIICKISA